MQSVKLSFGNPNLPSTDSIFEQIAELSGLRVWWQIYQDAAVVDGGISSVPSAAGVSSATLAQGSGARRPAYQDARAGGLYPAAVFDGEGDLLLASAVPYDKTGLFSIVFMGDVGTTGESQYLYSLFASVGQSTTLQLNTSGHVVFQHGNGTCVLSEDMRGVPLLIVAVSTGSQLRLYVNGREATPAATNNAQTATELVIGSANTLGLFPADMAMTDVLIRQANMLLDLDAMDLLTAFARRYYGVEIAA